MKTKIILSFLICSLTSLCQVRSVQSLKHSIMNTADLDTSTVPLNLGDKWFYGLKRLSTKAFVAKEITDTNETGVRLVSVTTIYPNKIDYSKENWSIINNNIINYDGERAFILSLVNDSLMGGDQGYFKSHFLFNGQLLPSQHHSYTMRYMSGAQVYNYYTALGLGLYRSEIRTYFLSDLVGKDSLYLLGAFISNQLYGDSINTITSIQNDEQFIPSFSLHQNHPNPFNPITEISFIVPMRIHIRLTVYDLIGREIACLVNEELESGNHHIKFDAANLTSGIYYYRLSAGRYAETKKMLLIK